MAAFWIFVCVVGSGAIVYDWIRAKIRVASLKKEAEKNTQELKLLEHEKTLLINFLDLFDPDTKESGIPFHSHEEMLKSQKLVDLSNFSAAQKKEIERIISMLERFLFVHKK